MSYTKIYIHAVWCTNRRQRVLTKIIREKLFRFLKDYAKEKKIRIIEMNGYLDHVHCLIQMDPQMSLSKTIQYLKGGSSFWINKNIFTNNHLQWSHRYYASSICENHISEVAMYIRNQVKHHTSMPYTKAYQNWLKDTEG